MQGVSITMLIQHAHYHLSCWLGLKQSSSWVTHRAALSNSHLPTYQKEMTAHSIWSKLFWIQEIKSKQHAFVYQVPSQALHVPVHHCMCSMFSHPCLHHSKPAKLALLAFCSCINPNSPSSNTASGILSRHSAYCPHCTTSAAISSCTASSSLLLSNPVYKPFPKLDADSSPVCSGSCCLGRLCLRSLLASTQAGLDYVLWRLGNKGEVYQVKPDALQGAWTLHSDQNMGGLAANENLQTWWFSQCMAHWSKKHQCLTLCW